MAAQSEPSQPLNPDPRDSEAPASEGDTP
jgi:hypothetical protein